MKRCTLQVTEDTRNFVREVQAILTLETNMSMASPSGKRWTMDGTIRWALAEAIEKNFPDRVKSENFGGKKTYDMSTEEDES